MKRSFYFSFKVLNLILAIGILYNKFTLIQCEEDLTLTLSEKLKLDQFKERVEPYLPHAYMKEEIYLIRWLRAKNFNIDAAVNMLNVNLKWRQAQRMDTVEEEDWSEYLQRYKYYDHAEDKQGQPVAYLELGSWDVRRAAISGERDKLTRYLDRSIQNVCNKPRLSRVQNKTSTVTQVDFIVDLNGFSLTQQGCLPCIPFYIGFVATYENYFPSCADKLVLINTPAAFDIILTGIRPFFSKQTSDSLKVYGTNKNKWLPVLLSHIDQYQLPPEIGGTDNRYEED